MIELLTADTPNGKKISIMLEEIEFDYKMESRGGQVIVFSDIKIDRTKFNIHYKSKTIFPTQFLDNFIYDEFIIKTNPIMLK